MAQTVIEMIMRRERERRAAEAAPGAGGFNPGIYGAPGTGPGQPPPATPGQPPLPNQPRFQYQGPQLRPQDLSALRPGLRLGLGGSAPPGQGGFFGGQQPIPQGQPGQGSFQGGGLGHGMSSQMMQAVLGPLMQPNYGVPQVNPAYLSGAMPTQGGLPADVMQRPPVRAGIGVTPTGARAL